MRPVLFALLLLAFLGQRLPAQEYEGKTLVTASLIADTTAIVPGKPFRVGVLLEMAPKWHTYWQYSGDAGIPTSIEWKLPEGWGVGPIEWPLPEAILEPGDIQVYAYGDKVMLIQQIQPPAEIIESNINLEANVSWLVCEEICIPGKATVSRMLPVAGHAEPDNAAIFEEWTAKLPSMDPPPFDVTWQREGDSWVGTVEAPASTEAVEFFPLPAEGEVIGHPKISGSAKDGFTIRISAPGDLRGVLAIKDANGERGWWVTASSPSDSSAAAPSPPSTSLWQALLFGFLGGIILNLMPCVLPVISLKVFGFVRQAGQSPRTILLHGLAFTAGIFVWFLGLGLVIVAIRAAGGQATWAFQFQNPWFNIAIATIVFVFALNLFGVFEIALPGRATNALAQAGGHEGYSGSFFQGVFATLLATPCTGPFLGASLGYAFAQPAPVTLALFACIAAGMALPYLLLSAQPGWVKYLPKPGLWMERLKQFMGFPLLAALLWLLYIIGAQRGSEAVIWVGAFLLTVGVACWIFGIVSPPVVPARSRVVGLTLSVLLLVGGGWLFLGDLLAKSRPASVQQASGGIPWEPYSKAAVDTLLAEGKPVFIDFTADWCLTCKYNERTAIDVPAVREKIQELGIVPVKADWTNSNPEITEALKQFGRVGVPFYVIYPAGRPNEPIILPELLTESLVLSKLSEAR